jgi:hypothetical protein
LDKRTLDFKTSKIMVKVVCFLLLTVISFPFSGFAQQNEVNIKGKILDEKTQEPIIGAGITITGFRGDRYR